MNLVPFQAKSSPPAESRGALVERMAADLVRFGAFGNEHDARLTLRVCRYPAFDIECLLDDARQVAVQDMVGREMSKP